MASSGFLYQLERIASFLASPHKGQVLDENLKIVSKYGFTWSILWLVSPFFQWFGIDVYSHVRVHNVAQRILSLCKQQSSALSENPHVFQLIKEEILDCLDKQTHGKYSTQLKAISDQLTALAPLLPKDYLGNVIWPHDLSTIGITPQQKGDIQEVIKKLFPQVRQNPFCLSIKFFKDKDKLRYLQLVDCKNWNHEKKVIQAEIVPFSFRFAYSKTGLIEKIVILAKHVVGEGAENKVRACHNLISGEWSVRKKCSDTIHKFLIKYFYEHPSPGIVPILDVQTKGENLQFFEPRFEGTLLDFLIKNGCSSLKLKLSLMNDLLQGLSCLHGLYHPGLCYTDSTSITESFYPMHYTYSFKLFHFDLKPANILVKRVDGVWRAVITDFGSSNPLVTGGTFGFSSPESISHECKLHGVDALSSRQLLPEFFFGKGVATVEFKLKYGQSSDIWALGLIFSTILSNRTSRLNPQAGWAPLTCIEIALINAISAPIIDNGDKFYLEIGLKRLTQPDINTSIKSLQQECSSSKSNEMSISNQLWELVSKMLTISPDQRINVSQALTEFSTIEISSRELPT